MIPAIGIGRPQDKAALSQPQVFNNSLYVFGGYNGSIATRDGSEIRQFLHGRRSVSRCCEKDSVQCVRLKDVKMDDGIECKQPRTSF